jgi:hypothetical protein
VTLSGSKYLLYTPKHLKTLVMEEMENIGNGEDPNSVLSRQLHFLVSIE